MKFKASGRALSGPLYIVDRAAIVNEQSKPDEGECSTGDGRQADKLFLGLKLANLKLANQVHA
jgi:hypothetical protein